MKVLNTIHAVIELAVHKIEEEISQGVDRSLDQHNISIYPSKIKQLGSTAIHVENDHFIYRCMETLSYLGCNAVKINSRSVIVACFENLVQLGRECRAAGRGCYSSRCIIPLHKHSEEFMGHILTWLVKEIKDDGTFPLKATAEQAYSRLRGVSCKVEIAGI